MKIFFFTGYPGFLGSELIRTLLPRDPKIKAICLVQKKFIPQAEKARTALLQSYPILKDRIEFIEGDITLADLGISNASVDFAQIEQIFHLAAVYDLSVKAELAHLINVVGTKNMLAFAEKCRNLKRFQYVSTCYVSGKHPGTFLETDLIRGQRFNNHYEETKYLAEVEVQKKLKAGMPISIYRPSVVVGNSKTGETQKFDGPYFVMQWLLRQCKIAFMPMIGNPNEHALNAVPSDFVIEAMSYLSQFPTTEGKVFQLADPKPLTIAELVSVLGEATQRNLIRIPLPLGLAKFALDYIPGVEWLLRIPSSTLNYFVHPTTYGTQQTQNFLEGSGITVPPFQTYSRKLAEFMIQNPKLRTKAMT